MRLEEYRLLIRNCPKRILMRMNPTATYANFEVLKIRDASRKNLENKNRVRHASCGCLSERQHSAGVFGFDVTSAGCLQSIRARRRSLFPKNFRARVRKKVREISSGHCLRHFLTNCLRDRRHSAHPYHAQGIR
jgi:hypothetical protein